MTFQFARFDRLVAAVELRDRSHHKRRRGAMYGGWYTKVSGMKYLPIFCVAHGHTIKQTLKGMETHSIVFKCDVVSIASCSQAWYVISRKPSFLLSWRSIDRLTVRSDAGCWTFAKAIARPAQMSDNQACNLAAAAARRRRRRRRRGEGKVRGRRRC